MAATIIYPVYANWVWGGGWLSALGSSFGLGHGHVDFAGSSVVHMTGGVMSFVLASELGPRQGKFHRDGSIKAIPGHSLPLVVLGTLILAFGWFGFNPGSTLAGTEKHVAIIAVNTMLSSGAGAVSAYLFTKLRYGSPDLSMMCNGLLGGLVAVTGPCAYVTSFSAVFIGAVAGMLVVSASVYIEQTLKVDDPVGAVSVHGVCGMWGILALGLFADGGYGDGLNGVAGPVRGLLYGDTAQLAVSLIGIATNIVWVGSVSYLSLKVIDAIVRNRCDGQDELDGLDVSELGGSGYATDVLARKPAPRVVDVAPAARVQREFPKCAIPALPNHPAT